MYDLTYLLLCRFVRFIVVTKREGEDVLQKRVWDDLKELDRIVQEVSEGYVLKWKIWRMLL